MNAFPQPPKYKYRVTALTKLKGKISPVLKRVIDWSGLKHPVSTQSIRAFEQKNGFGLNIYELSNRETAGGDIRPQLLQKSSFVDDEFDSRIEVPIFNLLLLETRTLKTVTHKDGS